jgi:hypothetical protein
MSWRRTTPAVVKIVVAITRTRRSVVKPPMRRWPPFGEVIEAGLAKGKLIGKEDF